MRALGRCADRNLKLRAALLLSGAAALAVAGCSSDGDRDGSAGETTVASGGSSSEGPTSSGASASAGETGDTGPAAAVTWHQDIAPIVAQKCGGCHVGGGIAPFSLATYA